MGTNSFQAEASNNHEHSIGSLLFGAFLAGAHEVADMAMDTAEAAGEIRAHYHEKRERLAEPESFSLGARKSLNSTFGNNALGLFMETPDVQKNWTPDLSLQMKHQPAPAPAFA